MVYKLLRQRKNPDPPPEIFRINKTTPKFKNQILSTIHEEYSYYPCGLNISHYSHETMVLYAIAVGAKPLPPGEIYNEDALYNTLQKLDNYDFFKLLDCLCHVLKKHRYDPMFNNNKFECLILELNEIMRINGIGYQISDGRLIESTKPTVFDEIINPCLSILRKNGLLNVDDCLLSSFNNIKKGDYPQSMMDDASKALECMLTKILDMKKIEYDLKFDLQSKFHLIKQHFPSIMGNHFANLDVLIRTSYSIRNTSGAHWTEEKDDQYILAKYVVDTVCADVLLLASIFYRD